MSVRSESGTIAEVFLGRATPVLASLRQNLVLFILVGFAVWLVLVPLAQLLIASFQGGTINEPEGWTLKHYIEAYSSKVTYEAIFNTLVYAVTATFLSLIIAVSFAWLTERTDLPWRNAAWTLLLIPMAMPGILFAMGCVPLSRFLPLRAVLNGSLLAWAVVVYAGYFVVSE